MKINIHNLHQVEQIGSGSYGKVYKCEHLVNRGEFFAVKIVENDYDSQTEHEMLSYYIIVHS